MNPIIYISIVLAICGLALFLYAYFMKPKGFKKSFQKKSQKGIKKTTGKKFGKKSPERIGKKEHIGKKPIPLSQKKHKKDEEYEKSIEGETEGETEGKKEKKKSIFESKSPFRKIKFAGLTESILGLLKKGKLSKDDELKIEEILLSSDVGYDNSHKIIEQLKTNLEKKIPPEQALVNEITDILKINKPREISFSKDKSKPTVIMVVGVNGVGKTTSIGKIGKQLKESGKSIIFGAGDTFRAAAVDQLQQWSKKVGAQIVANVSNDPAAVAYQTVQKAINENIDVAIIDTAGRLANKTNLMEELKKIHRVIEKLAPVNEILLVLDATVGQNGYKQSDAFYKAVNVTGIVLTKLDGSAKGGIIISVQKELDIPVKFVGIGEKVDDLKAFNPKEFAEQIV